MTFWDLQPPPTPPDPLPGQMFQWRFDVNDGTWFASLVTQEARHEVVHSVFVIKLGDLFTIITVDDPGPAQVDVPEYDGNGNVMGMGPPNKRWHVGLLRDRLFWLEHDWLSYCKLVE